MGQDCDLNDPKNVALHALNWKRLCLSILCLHVTGYNFSLSRTYIKSNQINMLSIMP